MATPAKKSGAAKKKTAAKKATAAKKPAAKKKSTAKKSAAKKPAAKKPAATKPAATKPAAKKPAVKKSSVVRKAGPKPVKKSLTLQSLVEDAEPAAASAPPTQAPKKKGPAALEAAPMPPLAAGAGSVRRKDVTNFMRQLIMLLEAGTPILRSLNSLAARGKNTAVRGLISDIAQFVEQGNPLWQAFDRHPRYFSTVEVNLIKASEASGTLVTVLKRMSVQREARAMLDKRVKGAMVYPVLLFAACTFVVWLLSHVVIPEFESMFRQANIDLEPFTENFFTVSRFCGNYWYMPLFVLIALVVVYKAWFVRAPLRRIFADKIKIKLPIIGKEIIQKKALVEMCQTMAMLLKSGLSMMATLDLTRNAISNRAVAETLQGVRDSVEQGAGLEAPLRAEPALIPPEMADMFATGEESGRVDAIAEHIGDTYEQEVNISVSMLSENMMPIFTVLVGGVVALLFYSLFQPMVSMMDQLTSAGV